MNKKSLMSSMKSVIALGVLFLSQLVWAGQTQLVLNWKPEPQFGGFYTAQLQGFYKKHGLDVKVVPGGAGTPTIQIVSAGKAEFGIVSGEEVPLSRKNDSDVVALFAVYQTDPQSIITHAERGFKSIKDVFEADGTLSVQRGLPYYMYLEKKLGKPKAKVVPSLGGITNFLADPMLSQQGFSTSEPLLAAKKGVKVTNFKVADEGFNPYLTVLVAKKSYVDQNSDQVKALVAAVREGWREYLDHPAKTNEMMHQLNSSMDLATFSESAAAQKEFIETSDTRAHSLGYMSAERWKTLEEQLVSIGLLESAEAGSSVFLNF